MIDKSRFPRRKVCGGGLTHHAISELPFGVSPVIHQAVDYGQVRFRGQLVKTIRGGKPIAYTIDRSSFDAFLLDRAVDQGAVFFPEERVISIQQDDDRIIVETNHNQYRCQYLVGSDGVHSVVAKQAGLMQKRRTSLAYEAVVSPSLNANGTEDQSVTFDFGTILFGYGWVFPKRDHLNVGVFRSWPGKCTSKKHLLRFIDQHPALNRDRIINIRAFPVPLGGEKTSLHLGNILLTGDAANLADPWLGEGLYYAILSGHLAAESIQKHICGEIPDMAYYTRQVNERIVKQFVYARWLSLLVNALPLINVALLKASPTLQKLTINLLRGDQTYQAVWQNLKHLPFKILSKII
jgi:geranylgeranyl reductase family protein